MDIEGKVCVVTGGAGGLGEATVRRLVTEGATVVVADVADDHAEGLVEQLGNAVEYVRTDVTDDASVAATLARAAALGELRTVVCAHGGPEASQRLVGRDGAPMPQELFDRTLRVYLSGTFNVMRQGAAAMARLVPLDSGVRGLIVNTASIAAFEGQIGQSDYAAAKGGVVSLSLVAARDLSAVGIRVNTIAPGTFFTPAFGLPEEEAQAKWGRIVPFPKRMGRPAEYADLVAFLVRNDYVNGETIRIDGAQRFGLK
ncbi:SDR family NAD(P)-dependent oxidoreductase [Mycobacterium nebraskense]|uniref:SDR family NAD(P)-dependent oxidoreductase n=1 Tax=Mycobacterium nebraskense TaxID=244292 RepID=UPI0006183175|nr:SDR family NAD(P)-dependent oxidoreductase [Mycobacterium nebraskense]KKC06738.1 3-hydroxy-2-methylbutyryl-CoA dehydrogenase [Mycobacterium nebraskense]